MITYKVNPFYKKSFYLNKFEQKGFSEVSVHITVKNVPAAHPELTVSSETSLGLGVNICSQSVLVWLLSVQGLASLMPPGQSKQISLLFFRQCFGH